MKVTLSFELAAGVKSDLVICMVLMALFAELTSAGLDANHIGVHIDDYRPVDID